MKAKYLVFFFIFELAKKNSFGSDSDCGKLSNTLSCMSFLVYSTFHYSVIYENPRTTIVLPNQTAVLRCAVNPLNGNDIFIVFVSDSDTSVSANKTEYARRGIAWDCLQSEVKTTFNISILGTPDNNGFTIRCGFGGCFTNPAQLIVVDCEYKINTL